MYDNVSNLRRLQYFDGLDLQYTYDTLNRMTGADGIQFTYDANSRITNTADGSINFGATYDNAGRLKTVIYNNGTFTVTYTYDSASGLLTRVSDNLTGAWVNLTYDNNQRLTGFTRSNGVNAAFSYDNAGRLTRIQDGTFLDLRYSLDAAGQVTQTQMTAPLDPGVNIIPRTTSLTYDAASQISSTGYTYDAFGCLTTAPGQTYTWNGASRLVGIGNVTLTYNGLGNVRTRSKGGTTTHYFYNYALTLRPIVAEQNQGTGQFLRYYVWTPGGRLLYMIDAADGNKVYFCK